MAEYFARLQADMKTAMKARDELRLRVARMLVAAIKKEQIDRAKDDLGADAELDILRKAVKTRRESVDQAQKLGRQDVVQAEAAEIAVIEAYLPATLSGDALLAKVREVAQAIGYTGAKDTGRFMKEWMARHKALADGRDVQEALKRLG
ncbi:MAG: GatB/YqeY domain-containing protein [Planctomycetes bacterium]|nr:GatB/YqeY domain-containing protein [Planctomycetota bacterium]